MTVTNWNCLQIIATVPPDGLAPGVVNVRATGVWSNLVSYTVPAPVINYIYPSAISVGNPVWIYGSGFGPVQDGNGAVWIGQEGIGTIDSWNDTQIIATVPSTVKSSSIIEVRQFGDISNAVSLHSCSSTEHH